MLTLPLPTETELEHNAPVVPRSEIEHKTSRSLHLSVMLFLYLIHHCLLLGKSLLLTFPGYLGKINWEEDRYSTGYEKCIPILQMLITALLLWLEGKQSWGSYSCLCSYDNIQQLLSTYANIPNLTISSSFLEIKKKYLQEKKQQ